MEEATVDQPKPTNAAEEEKANVDEDVIAEEATLEPQEPQEPTTSELFAVVDRIFLESDTDTVTVKDVKNSVAAHFGLQKVSKEMKKAIRDRLTDLIQGNVQPTGAMEETTPEDDHEDDQEDVVAEQVGFSIDETENGDGNNAECGDESSSARSFSGDNNSLELSGFSHDDSPHINNSQSDSVGINNDQLAMSGTLFQNLSPEFSIHSRSTVDGEHYKEENDIVKMKSISSPLISSKPKSRSVVVKGKWSLGPEIGIGSFGRVHTGLNTLNGSKCHYLIIHLSD